MAHIGAVGCSRPSRPSTGPARAEDRRGAPRIPRCPGNWCIGNTAVSKTAARGSTPRFPARQMPRKLRGIWLSRAVLRYQPGGRPFRMNPLESAWDPEYSIPATIPRATPRAVRGRARHALKRGRQHRTPATAPVLAISQFQERDPLTPTSRADRYAQMAANPRANVPGAYAQARYEQGLSNYRRRGRPIFALIFGPFIVAGLALLILDGRLLPWLAGAMTGAFATAWMALRRRGARLHRQLARGRRRRAKDRQGTQTAPALPVFASSTTCRPATATTTT